MTSSFFRSAVFVGAIAFGTAGTVGCTSSNSVPPNPPPPPPTTGTVTSQLTPAGGTLTFPTIAGVARVDQYGASTQPAATTVTATATTMAPVVTYPAGSAPTGTPIIYFTEVFSQQVTFTGPIGITVTLPSNIPTTGHTFTAFFYDATANVAIANEPALAVNGQNLSFGIPPQKGPPAGDVFLFVLTTS